MAEATNIIMRHKGTLSGLMIPPCNHMNFLDIAQGVKTEKNVLPNITGERLGAADRLDAIGDPCWGASVEERRIETPVASSSIF